MIFDAPPDVPESEIKKCCGNFRRKYDRPFTCEKAGLTWFPAQEIIINNQRQTILPISCHGCGTNGEKIPPWLGFFDSTSGNFLSQEDYCARELLLR